MSIPGGPPRWTPLPGKIRLHEDSGDYFRDKNASKYPPHLMESTVLAGLTLNPHLLADLDIVGCYNSLGNLVRFVLGWDKSFRILVQAVDNTVFFVRRENSPTEKIQDIKGHGYAFLEAYTSWDRGSEGSDTHHRILKYNFGGLSMLVRAEADAYVADPSDHVLDSGSSRSTKTKANAPRTASTLPNIADLTETLSGLNTSNPSPRSIPSAATNIAVVPSAVEPVSQSQILEIKTRGIWKRDRKRDKEDTVSEEMLPKLWLAQIPKFVVAYHDHGTFDAADIQIQNVRPQVGLWEQKEKRGLAALAALLHRVCGMVKAREDKKLELRWTGTGALEIREQLADAGEMLSEGMKERWSDRKKCCEKPVEPVGDEKGQNLGEGVA